MTRSEPSGGVPGDGRRIVVGASAMILSNLVVAVLAVVTVHVVAQSLGQRKFGQFTTVVAFVSLLGLLADIGVSTITGRDVAARPEDASRTIGTALACRLALCALTVPALVGASWLIYPGDGAVVVGVALFAGDLVLTTVQSVAQTYYLGTMRNEVPAVVLLVGKALYCGGAIVVGAGTPGALIGFLAAYLVADGLGAAVSLVLTARACGIDMRFEPRAWLSLLATAAPIGLSEVLSRIYARLDSVLLSVMRPVVDVARYGIAYNFTEVLSRLPIFVMNAAMPSMVRSGGGEQLRRQMQTALDVVALGAVPLAAGGFLLRDEIVRLVAGPGYTGADLPLAVLILSVVVSSPQVVFTFGCLAVGALRPLGPAIAVTTALNVVLNIALIPSFGPVGSALAQCATEAFSAVVTYRIYRRGARAGLRFARCAAFVLAAAPLFGAAPAIRPLLRAMPTLASPFVGAALLGALYALLVLVLGALPDPVRAILSRRRCVRWVLVADQPLARLARMPQRRSDGRGGI